MGSAGRDLTLRIQTLDDTIDLVVADTFLTGAGNFINFELTAAQAAILDGLSVGDRFIFAGTRPEAATTTDHAVNAGDASHVYAVPQPSVTRTPATTAGVVSVTVPLTGVSVLTNYIRWSDNQSLGSLFDANGEDQTLTTVDLNSSTPSGQVFISIIGSNNRFTPAFEASGIIIFEASDGRAVGGDDL